MSGVPESPGDPRDPEFPALLTQLGSATRGESRAGICFDILRVFGDVPSGDLYDARSGRSSTDLEGWRDGLSTCLGYRVPLAA